MTTEMFMVLVRAIIAICGVIVTAYIVPFIKDQYSASQLDEIDYYVRVAVRCAEQIFTPEQWQEKKAYVRNYLQQKLNAAFKIGLTDADIETIIEGIVQEIKHGGDAE